MLFKEEYVLERFNYNGNTSAILFYMLCNLTGCLYMCVLCCVSSDCVPRWAIKKTHIECVGLIWNKHLIYECQNVNYYGMISTKFWSLIYHRNILLCEVIT